MLDPSLSKRERAELVGILAAGLHVDTRSRKAPFYNCPVGLTALSGTGGCNGHYVKDVDESALHSLCASCPRYAFRDRAD